MVANLPADFAKREVADHGIDLPIGGETDLKYWFGGTTHGEIADDVKSWWTAQEDLLLHISGPTDMDFLYFAYPLTGDFAIELDSYEGDWAETDAGYGGVFVESQAYGSRMRLKSLSAHETVYRPKAYLRKRESWGSVKVEAEAGKMRYWLNNYPVHEEKLVGTSPFFVLFTEGPRLAAYKNMRLTGNPTIPREVSLISEDSLDGWNTSFANENQPRKRLMAEPETGDDNDYNSYYKRNEPTEFDWDVKQGVLTAKAKPDAPANNQSWAYYHRPLRNNETFRYEFYYTPDVAVAHPTFGRLAMLLQEDGVTSHWIARSGWDEAMLGVGIDNGILEEGCQRSEDVPLKENDWNAVELKLADGTVSVSLNGDLVFEREMTDLSDTRFGFYRRQQQELKVRNVVLTGDWPEEFTDEMRQNLFALSKPKSTESMHAIQRLATDKYFVKDIRSVIAKASSLGKSDKNAEYEFLKNWVLPSEAHPTLRLNCQLPLRSGATETNEEIEFACPATRMLELAAELHKLDELTAEIDALSIDEDVTVRHKQTMQAIAAIHQGNAEKTKELLGEAYERCVAGLPDYLEERDRQVEMILIWEAAKHPKTQLAAHDLAKLIRNQQREKKTSSDFYQLSESMLGHTARSIRGDAGEEQLTQWHPVLYDKPETRGRGLRPSKWSYRRGSLSHLPGEAWTQLYFQSPLQGKFEIHAERTLFGYKETHISYGGHAAEPEHDQSSVTVTKVMHNSKNQGGAVKIPGWSDEIGDYRIVVDGKRVTTFVNDVKIHEEQMKASPDPWLLLQTNDPQLFGTVNNLRIMGEPEVPDEIQLLEGNGLANWRADTYGESFRSNDGGNTNAPWSVSGEELQASLRKNKTGKNRESLMMYQRPMLEDGEIEFEAFFNPGAVEVHPAIGRVAFMINKEGVRLHQLTDAEWEYDPELTTDNAKTLSSDPIELKESDWNHYRLKLEGDTLTISVNDKVVCEHEINELPNARFFGLFRYSDQTKARVRKVVYRGEWPKELPKLEDQELAYPAGGPMQFAAVEGTEDFPLSSVEAVRKEGWKTLGDKDSIADEEDGLRIQLTKSEGEGERKWTGLQLNEQIIGDFEATVAFRDLQMKRNEEGWGICFGLQATTADGMTEVSVALDEKEKLFAKSIWQYKLPNGKQQTNFHRRSKEFRSGRLKLVRNGGSMHCLIAPAEGDFQLLQTFDIGTSPVREISVQNKCSDNVGEIDVVVSKLTLSKQKNITSEKVSVSKPIDRESIASVE